MPVYTKKGPKGVLRHQVVIYHRGRRHSWTVGGVREPATRAEALAFEARERLKLESGQSRQPRVAPTFSAFCAAEYRTWASNHLSAATWDHRVYQLATLDQWFGPLRLTEISAEAIERFKRESRIVRRTKVRWVGEGEKRKRREIEVDVHRGPAMVNDDLKVLRAVLGYAQELHYPVALPKIRKLKERGRPGRIHVWSLEEVGRLFERARESKPDLLPVLVFLANTGARKTESIRLRWPSVDLAAGVVWIEPTGEDVDEEDAWAPKDNEARRVPISPTLRLWLEQLQASAESEWVFTWRRGQEDGRGTGKRHPWRRWPQKAFDEARAAAELAGGPHTLRHTYASHFLAAKPDLFLLSKILGHSHERTTSLYAHLIPGALEASASVVDVAPSVGPAALEAQRRWTGGKA